MPVSMHKVLEEFDADARARIKLRTHALAEEELTLRDLRQAHELTQERMASLLGVKQESISRIERRTDLLLSTLASYIEAMGGHLKLVAEFPNRNLVVIKTLADIEGPAPIT
jgi:DNA-binding XRE family transcriptional regulator